MAYFRDMTVCTYFTGAAHLDWFCRLIAIGWLESGHEFSTGPADSRILEKLSLLRLEFGAMFPAIAYRGLHVCSLCGDKEPLSGSHINLFVPTTGFVYAAPARIDHYIEAHQYVPPEHFVDALIECPNPKSAEYRAAMASANRGYDAPIFSSIGR